MYKSVFISCLIFVLTTVSGSSQSLFQSSWNEQITRTWIGSDFWANRLEDWRITIGRLECIQEDPDKPMRTVHLITYELTDQIVPFSLSVRTGLLGFGTPGIGKSWSGFLVGAGNQSMNYRSSALVHHYSGTGGGLIIGLDDTGHLVFRSNEDREDRDEYPLVSRQTEKGGPIPRGRSLDNWEDILMSVEGVPDSDSTYTLTVTATDYLTGKKLSSSEVSNYSASLLTGNVALVSHGGYNEVAKRYWFRDFQVAGKKFEEHLERAFGPILNAMYSLNHQKLRMNIQFPPLGFADDQEVTLMIRNNHDVWEKKQVARINALSFTAHFKIEDWDSSKSAPYGFKYAGKFYSWGTIAADPVDKEEIKVAAITCYQTMALPADDSWGKDFAGQPEGRWTRENIWFPSPVADQLVLEKPDLLTFLGDQIYESGSPTTADVREKNPALDYLYKWFLFLWNFNETTRNQPTIVLGDDHDVYQGDLWGDAGQPSVSGNNKDGGYTMDPAFVRLVEITQTSHNPNPYLDKPIKQGIGSYFGSFKYGGIGFAILEDRKFKSLPTVIGDVQQNGSKITEPNYDPEKANIPGTTLLGDDQISFLKSWVNDWEGEHMKLAFTQTIFSSLHTNPKGEIWKDIDSGGWPQGGRDEALSILRKGFVSLLSGDTHLATVVQHGIEKFNDAPYQFVVPPVSNKYRRWWTPDQVMSAGEDTYAFHGNFLDGLHNKVSVKAIANPYIDQSAVYRENVARGRGYGSEHIYLNSSNTKDGYGVVILNKTNGQIVFAAKNHQGKMHDEWPVKINHLENFEERGAYRIKLKKDSMMPGSLIRVLDSDSGELIYNFRVLNEQISILNVLIEKRYDIIIENPQSGKVTKLKGIMAESKK